MRLRYVGTHTVTFTNPLVGEVQPGDEFHVPDDQVAGFLVRADIVTVSSPVSDVSPTRRRRTTSANEDSTSPPIVESSDATVPDDTGDDVSIVTDNS